MSSPSSERVSGEERSAPRAGARPDDILAWSGVWLGVLALGALFLWTTTPLSPGCLPALLAAAAPAAAGLVLRRWDGPDLRFGLIAALAGCAAIAAAFTGGAESPLALFALAPMALALLEGGARRTAQAAALSLTALATSALAQAAGAATPRPAGPVAAGLSLVGLATLASGFAAALALAERRRAAASVGRTAALSHPAPATTPSDGRPAGAASAPPASCELDAAPALIFAADDAGRILASAGAPPPGVDPARLQSEGLAAVAPEAGAAEIAEAIARARSGLAASTVFNGPDGESRLSLTLAPVMDGRICGVLADVTVLARREAALEAARSDAEALALGKSRFLANMSHELRTPLNAIMGFSDIMRERIFGPLPGKYVEYADLIHDAGSHLLDLINDVLDMSKIEAARYELNLERLDAREPVSAALRLLRVQADDLGIQLRGVLPSVPVDVDADRRAIKQITLNLVSNALKFTPRGGQVTVSLHILDKAMELSVSDTGVGIAESDLERLGRPYEQAGAPGQQALGTGLGLSLVRAFAELHGGEMAIESRLGEGTAVTVRLPAPEGEAASGPSAPDADPTPAPGASAVGG